MVLDIKNCRVIYLHGLASGPTSYKANFFRESFLGKGLEMEVPDLNQEGFVGLTLSRQFTQVKAVIEGSSADVILVGSSLGGLTVAQLVETCLQIKKVFLIAPALDFLQYWLAMIPVDSLEAWQQRGLRQMHHYGYQQSAMLSYRFVEDLRAQPKLTISRQIPFLIFHGLNDEIIPYTAIQRFTLDHPWMDLYPLEGDHSLLEHLPMIWQQMELCL